MNYYNKYEVRSRWLLYILVGTLVFEGIVRKRLPGGGLSVIVFFLKDFLCVTGIYFIAANRLTSSSKRIVNLVKFLIILLYPLLCYQLSFEPILFLWGGKLYLLYTVSAILMTIAFPFNEVDKFKTFIGFIVLLLIPTVFLGILQLGLPASHWLNRSVGGESLENFSAGGVLRISSTFSFTGQYSFFLTFASAIYFCFIFIKSNLKVKLLNNKLYILFIGVLLFMGCFSTGGKTAVLGLLAILMLGSFFITLRNPSFIVTKMLLPFIFFVGTIPLVQAWKPEVFSVFKTRANSKGGSSEDLLERVMQPFSDLNTSSIFGNGLGVMTNGADKISTYAATIRATSWTESDFSTIVWEGGLYLVITWYIFRLFLVFYSLKILFSLKTDNYYNAAAFLVPFIIIQGLIGTLTIQPPIAIYFWICFGALLCIQQFDMYEWTQGNRTTTSFI